MDLRNFGLFNSLFLDSKSLEGGRISWSLVKDDGGLLLVALVELATSTALDQSMGVSNELQYGHQFGSWSP